MLNKKNIKTDLCVIGGGIAGICTAISAAREGIKVVLMHERPVLGGNASSEIRMWVCGAQGNNNRETGILEEIALENYQKNPTKNYFIWDSLLYDFITREKNITLLLNTTCMDADVTEGNFTDDRNIKINQLTGYQMTSQTLISVYAKLFADCSGDSITAPLTGAEFKIGREGKNEYNEDTVVEIHDEYTMGNSCLIQGRETTKKIKYTPPSYSLKLKKENFKERNPDLYKESENFWYLELGGNKNTIDNAEDISSELISLATGTWDYIKNSGEYNSDNFELDFMGFLPGKRESRRMVGEYTITQKDISNDTRFSDGVAFGGWPLDDHFPDGFYHKGRPNTYIKTPAPYVIPYRILYSKNVENLFFAGRNISMTHTAMSSIRVMATCGVCGQAVGTAASLCIKYNTTPNGVYKNHINELQNILMDNDCFIPHKKRVVSPTCEKSEIINGNNSLKDGTDRYHEIYNNPCKGVMAVNNQSIKYLFDNDVFTNSIHITFDSDLNRESLPGGQCEKYHTMRANTLLNSPDFYVPLTLCKKFKLYIINNDNEELILDVDNNILRAYNIKINKKIKGIILTPEENYGNTNKTRILSFDFKGE